MFPKTGRPREKRYPRHAKAEFALRFDMITQEEYQGIISGQMWLEKRLLTNLNVDLPWLKTGESTTITQGRASELKLSQLLDLPYERK